MRPKSTAPGPNPSGLCMCGCGQPAPIAKWSHARRGNVGGEPQRYIRFHAAKAITKPLSALYVVNEATGCWEWVGRRDTGGYGMLKHPVNGTRRAHRVVYEVHHGPIPKGLVLDHRCPSGPNRLCVNPDHLAPTTSAENTRRGKNAKLTHADAAEIRALKGKFSQRQLAERYGVRQGIISRILLNKGWRMEAAPADEAGAVPAP
jgi:hypothetical protein